MDRFTHVIIDEVHERNQDMDFILIIIKKLLQETSPGVKVSLLVFVVVGMKAKACFEISCSLIETYWLLVLEF